MDLLRELIKSDTGQVIAFMTVMAGLFKVWRTIQDVKDLALVLKEETTERKKEDDNLWGAITDQRKRVDRILLAKVNGNG